MEDKSSSNSNFIRKEAILLLDAHLSDVAQKSTCLKEAKLSSALKENIKRRKDAIKNRKIEKVECELP